MDSLNNVVFGTRENPCYSNTHYSNIVERFDLENAHFKDYFVFFKEFAFFEKPYYSKNMLFKTALFKTVLFKEFLNHIK